MKPTVLGWGLSLGIVSTVLPFALPACAQFVSIPVTNGSFALTRVVDNQYVAPLTLLSPAGTINITGTPNLPTYQGGVVITTDTPIGVYIGEVSGSASLTDGRTATFSQTAAAKLETLATVTGAPSYDPSFGLVPIPLGATVSFTVKSGSLDIPEAALSAYPTSQITIPITGGSFTVQAPIGAAQETLTINSALTPVGTTTLTLSYPTLVDPGNATFPYLIGTAAQSVRISGLVSGTVAFNDGRTATLQDRLVVFASTVQVTNTAPNDTYRFPTVYTTSRTLVGAFTGGVVSVPASDVTLPSTPPNAIPPLVVGEAVSPETEFVLGVDGTLNLGGEPNGFVEPNELTEPNGSAEPGAVRSRAKTISLVECSSLEVSRIHPGLRVSAQKFGRECGVQQAVSR